MRATYYKRTFDTCVLMFCQIILILLSLQEATCDSLNFVLQLCDASLLVANISQLRAVLDSGSANEYYLQLLVIIIISIVSHILFGMLMILRWKIKRKKNVVNKQNSDGGCKKGCCICGMSPSVKIYDKLIMSFMLIVVILNVAIAGLGLSESGCPL